MKNSEDPSSEEKDIKEVEETKTASDVRGLQLVVIGKTEGDNDKLILETLRTIGKTQQSICDSVMSIVADAILRLEHKKGSELIFPITGIILRNFKDKDLSRTTLQAMLKVLLETESPAMQFEQGITLGDTATHFAAGYTGNRHLRRIMGEKELQDYSRHMAIRGYSTALNAVPRCNTQKARNLEEPVVKLINRFREMVEVLNLVLKTKEIEEIKKTRELEKVSPSPC